MHTINHNNVNGKEDLKGYSDAELSLRVFNDESLYSIRHNRKVLLSTLEELFDYTNDQEIELINDLDEDDDQNEVQS